MKKKLYKFLRTGLKSERGNCTWKIGEWKKEEEIRICNKGFHAFKTPLQALGYVKGEILAEVEVRGTHEKEDDKEVWSEMKIAKAWNWTKEDSVELAIYSAELVIDIFEKKYPQDDRPRKAIEAAKKYLEVVKNGGDAYAAVDAFNASYAAAARSAYYAAVDASNASYAAAASFASSASSAASSAADASNAAYYASYVAYYAADNRKTLVKKIDDWFIKKIKTLTKYE